MADEIVRDMIEDYLRKRGIRFHWQDDIHRATKDEPVQVYRTFNENVVWVRVPLPPAQEAASDGDGDALPGRV